MNSPNQHVSVGSSDRSDMPNIAVNVQKVADTIAIGNQAPEVATEVPKFWLTLEEKQSIEDDINAGKPIGDTPAYWKFLKSIFPNMYIRTLPYLANYDDAVIIVSKLSELLERPVRLPTSREALSSLEDNNHLTGFRGVVGGYNGADYRKFGNAGIGNIGIVGCAWISGELRGGKAPSATRTRGNSFVLLDDRCIGLSVIPVFG